MERTHPGAAGAVWRGKRFCLLLPRLAKEGRPGGRNPIQRAPSLIGLALLLAVPTAKAFDLSDLSAQLAKPIVVRGPFVQEKHLRALPTPLTSQGQFTLSRDHGLLWLLQKPLKQDYRIADSGIARRTAEGKTKAEIIRCLKRLLAREIWSLMRPLRINPQTVESAA